MRTPGILQRKHTKLKQGCTMGRGCVSSNTPKRIPSCSNPTSPNLIMNRDASKDREKREISHLHKLVSLCVSNSAKHKKPAIFSGSLAKQTER
ncbi:hypothetical protein EUGRSUZ_L03013 [Eucalyptus grandis]|uniref:Uncharacterized protein n=1 Tax=Eucalyptus grandis TaxID=71139 RepID=A0AAD9WIL1_EUCGR|nr:hypothetical protein EUGRSUZ_L03013 [Eucalyptus grandis]